MLYFVGHVNSASAPETAAYEEDEAVEKAEERQKLMAFLVVLEDEAHAEYAAKLAQRIDDKSPSRWLTPEQCERELGLSDAPK